jgi:hypothetical protein
MTANFSPLQWVQTNEGPDRRWHIAAYGSKSALCDQAVPAWPREDLCDHRKACSKCIEKLIFAKRADSAKEG